MIDVFSAPTANEAWIAAMDKMLSDDTNQQESRLGDTIELLHANFNIYDPRQRWVLSRLPAINPGFAVAEAIWILSGSNDARFINHWNPILPRFAGTSPNYHGAYGYRIRHHFGFDQLERAYLALKNNHYTRQVVIQIWDSKSDLPNTDGKPVDPDIPCNICAMPKIRNNRLEWLQIMRSNDLYRGTPYNVVQFTTIQEILAGWLNVEIGSYHQISDCLHIYKKDDDELSYDKSLFIPQNTDSLSISKQDFDKYFGVLFNKMQLLSSTKLTLKDFSKITISNSLPQSYKNLLLTAAADSARRRGWADQMQSAHEVNTNPVLQLAFERWLNRYPVNKQ